MPVILLNAGGGTELPTLPSHVITHVERLNRVTLTQATRVSIGQKPRNSQLDGSRADCFPYCAWHEWTNTSLIHSGLEPEGF